MITAKFDSIERILLTKKQSQGPKHEWPEDISAVCLDEIPKAHTHPLPEISLPVVIDKKWGSETIIANEAEYCGKILSFNRKGAKFSVHSHSLKKEAFLIRRGDFKFVYIDTSNAKRIETTVHPFTTIKIPQNLPHQLICLSDYGEVVETSTHHSDLDSYRYEPGDSQS